MQRIVCIKNAILLIFVSLFIKSKELIVCQTYGVANFECFTRGLFQKKFWIHNTIHGNETCLCYILIKNWSTQIRASFVYRMLFLNMVMHSFEAFVLYIHYFENFPSLEFKENLMHIMLLENRQMFESLVIILRSIAFIIHTY